MKKVGVVSVLLLFALLAAMVFRYGRLEPCAEGSKYVDRWTGIAWVRVEYAYGQSRVPASCFEPSGTATPTDQEMASELMRITKTENVLLFVWWALLLLCLAGVAMGLVKPRVVPRKGA